MTAPSRLMPARGRGRITHTRSYGTSLDHTKQKNFIIPSFLLLVRLLPACSKKIGGNLYLESIKNQIALHLLRQYAKLDFKEGQCRSGFTPLQRRLLLEFINENMSIKITLEDLAGLVKMSVPHLMRKFKVDFGCDQSVPAPQDGGMQR